MASKTKMAWRKLFRVLISTNVVQNVKIQSLQFPVYANMLKRVVFKKAQSQMQKIFIYLFHWSCNCVDESLAGEEKTKQNNTKENKSSGIQNKK